MAVDQTLNISRAPASWRSYLELCKPKVVALITFTTFIGMLLAAPGLPPWSILIFGTLGIGLSAASGVAINHWVDRRIDLVMGRTNRRPLPKGDIPSARALGFALTLGVVGLAVLIVQVNLLAALLTVNAGANSG